MAILAAPGAASPRETTGSVAGRHRVADDGLHRAAGFEILAGPHAVDERHGFPLAHCLERAELEAALGARLRLEGWWDIDRDGELLAGSLWQRRSG